MVAVDSFESLPGTGVVATFEQHKAINECVSSILFISASEVIWKLLDIIRNYFCCELEF